MAGTLGGKERWVATGSIGALIGGMIVGEMLHRAGATATVSGFSVAGDLILVRPLMMLVLPLIFTSVVAGITSLGDPSRLGKLGLSTSAYFLATMLVAATLGATLVTLVGPGFGLAPEDVAAVQPAGPDPMITNFSVDCSDMCFLSASIARSHLLPVDRLNARSAGQATKSPVNPSLVDFCAPPSSLSAPRAYSTPPEISRRP